MQNIADVLTKAGASKDVPRKYLRGGYLSLPQTEENRQLKDAKMSERSRRNVKKRAVDEQKRAKELEERRARRALEVAADEWGQQAQRRKSECGTSLSLQP